MQIYNTTSYRDATFDVMKGVAILLVIVGHLHQSADVGDLFVYKAIKRCIFSFHMPLFFILAGYFYKKKKFKEDFKRLIIPCLFISLVYLLYTAIVSFIKQDLSASVINVIGVLKEVAYGSGGQHGAMILGDVPVLGALWFLWAMFWGKRLFGILEDIICNVKFLGVVCLTCSVAFSLLDNFWVYIPLSFNQGMTALIFIYVGYVLRKKLPNTVPLKIIALLIFLYLVDYPLGFIALDHSSFECYPLNVVGASSATLFIYYVSKKYIKGAISKALSWCGYHSLLILCVHHFFLKAHLPPPPEDVFLVLFVSVFSCILITYILSKILFIKRIYHL